MNGSVALVLDPEECFEENSDGEFERRRAPEVDPLAIDPLDIRQDDILFGKDEPALAYVDLDPEKKVDPLLVDRNDSETRKQTGVRKCERFLRKQRSKYDPAEYVFPSLKRRKKEPIFKEASKKKKGPKPLKKNFKGQSPKVKRIQQGRQSESETQADVAPCSLCNFTGSRDQDKMITCRSCLNKGHLSCIKRDGFDESWFCPDCKTSESSICVICDQKSVNKDDLITCELCAESFHGACHKPAIKLPFAGSKKWRCYRCPSFGTTLCTDLSPILEPLEESKVKDKCKEEDPEESPEETRTLIPFVRLDRNEATLDTAQRGGRERPTDGIKEDPFAGHPIDPDVPDAMAWTCSDVYQYFLQHFNKEIALAFHEQDIDGQSLLLMRRTDVLKGLGLKLGTALKVLYHVKKLQIRRSDLKLLWTS